MGFSSRNAAIAVLVLGIVISSIRKYAQAPLPVTKVDMADKVIIVTGEHDIYFLEAHRPVLSSSFPRPCMSLRLTGLVYGDGFSRPRQAPLLVSARRRLVSWRTGVAR